MFIPLVNKYLLRYIRVDIIFDRYMIDSIKNRTRQNRGSGGRFHTVPETPIPRDWKAYLRNADNKSELFKLIAVTLQQNINVPDGKELYFIKDENVLSIPSILPKLKMSPCSHEEVDTRIFLHTKDAVEKGLTRVVLKATDTDIVVIGVALFDEIGAEELWIQHGPSDKLKLIPVHQIRLNLGPSRSRGLLFFHAITGCDTTTAFAGFSKVSSWNVWNQTVDTFNYLFERLSFFDFQDDPKDDMQLIEKFVSALYLKLKGVCTDEINTTRKNLFLTKGLSLDKLPPTQDVLYLKAKRSVIQASIWRKSLYKSPVIPEKTLWGWKREEDGSLSLQWSTLPDIIKGCWETFIKCNCKVSNCLKNCSCRNKQLVCTTLCGCKCNDTS